MYEYLGVYEDPVGVKIHVWKGPNPSGEKGPFVYFALWLFHPEYSEPDYQLHKYPWPKDLKRVDKGRWKLVWSPQDEEELWI